MGRKKRKIAEIDPSTDDAEKEADVSESEAPPPQEPTPAAKLPVAIVEPEITSAPASSSYAVTSHSAEIIGEDIYVSDGSEDEEGETAEILLAGSRMGLMRRGLFHPSLVQPNRQWQREQEAVTNTEAEDEKREQEMAKLDPAQRAARLLAEKLRKLEEAKETARRAESEENAGRDPCLFSKRTAFDIRMDQMEDKPWEHGSGDVTDYFNYNFGEEDWLEYSQQQLQIRQELTDASKQRRAPDPTIVPVSPRAPKKQTPRVAVVGLDVGDTVDEANATTLNEHGEDGPVIGPVIVKTHESMDVKDEEDGKKEVDIMDIGKGGAWGAGAAPGSTLARLIEEQERKDDATAAASSSELNVTERGNDDDRDRDADDWSQRSDWRDRGDYGGGYQQQPQQQQPPQHSPPPYGGRRGGHFPPPARHGGPPPPFYGGGRGYRPPYPPNPNLPPPWAARGRRGDFRGRHNGDYGGDRYMR